jgi:hypothetical protein
MATIVKLTYTQTGATTLVNLDNMKTAYRIFEKEKQVPATRINFATNDFIIVDEELKTIDELNEAYNNGEYQAIDWTEESPKEESRKSIKQKLIGDYRNNTRRVNVESLKNY